MKFEKVTNLVQTFPEICINSCSKNGEVRNFNLYRDYYNLRVGKYNFKLFDSLKLSCQNCGWSSTIPGQFAKKVFKQGLKSNVLIRYAKNPLLTSQVINLLGYLWRVWLISLGVLVLLVIFRFYSEPVIVSEPEVLSVDQAKSSKYLGKIVKVEGIVDYPLSFSKEIEINQGNGSTKLVSTEIYIPIFSETDNTNFIVLHGGGSDVQNVLGRTGITNADLLYNQKYSSTGLIEPISTLNNNELKSFYTEELPKLRNLNPTTVVLDSTRIVTLNEFLNRYLPFAMILGLLLGLSIATQIYIDRKIHMK